MKEAEAKRECPMRVISLAERDARRSLPLHSSGFKAFLGFYIDKLAFLFIFLYTF
jgi:hypothetical protein